MNPSAPPDWLDDYRALTEQVGFVPLERTLIELSGKDRSSFLHNLTTNEIKKLAPGAGCEAFITSVQGKTVGHGLFFVEPDSIVVDSVAGQAETLLKHLDHYLVCEQVELRDQSQQWFELPLAGSGAESLLARLWQVEIPPARYSTVAFQFEGRQVRVRRADLTSSANFLLAVEKADAGWLQSQLTEAGARHCSQAAFEAARIEHGTPHFGLDLSDKNLPQELARDSQAISFVKGCYLGQETVARIDALGHVNKTLVGVRLVGDQVPEIGSELRAGEQVVGNVTSSTFSPRLGSPLALAYVKAGHNRPQTPLSSPFGEAEVVALPVA